MEFNVSFDYVDTSLSIEDQVLAVLRYYYPDYRVGCLRFHKRDNGENTISVKIEDSVCYLSFLPDGCRSEIYQLINK